jgi:replication fork clamp-binding protein CrfC
MYSFEFDTILPLRESNTLGKGFFICIWHADKIPPHIGVITEGRYFSLKVRGKDEDVASEEVVKLIRKKEISAVFLEVLTNTELMKVRQVFSQYDCLEENKNTCLTPIAEIFDRKDEAQVLADLLSAFRAMDLIGNSWGLNLPADYRGVPFYGKKEIGQRLLELRRKRKVKC